MAKAIHAQRQKEVRAILDVTKKLLKDRGLSYKDVGKHWHLSLPAVKAAMNSNNLPLSRMLSLCDLLDVAFKDLLAIVSRELGTSFRFSEEEEKFFAKNPLYLSYLLELKSKSPEEIERRHKISARSTRHYLKVLEKMGLIQVFPGDKVKSRVKGTVMWSDHGPLGATFSKAMVLQFAEWASKKMTAPERMVVELQGWTITPEQYAEFHREYRALIEKYRDIGALNQQILPADKHEKVSIMLLADYWDCPMFREIKELK